MTTTRNVAFRTLGASAIVVLGAACAWEPFGPDATINLANVVAAPAVLIGAGDIAGCDKIGDEQTADLIDSLLVEHPDGTVFTAGDNVYPDGTAQDYADCYEPSWGRFKHRTWATLGNHDYGTGNADASFDYFGARVGPRDLGYYSVDVGGWHLVMLNTGRKRSVPVHAGSVQEQWLRADLAAANHACVMAVFHHPLGSSCSSGYCASDAFWDALYEYAADVVVAGHVHHYERSDPMDPDGNLDPISGIRQFIVGTGGSKGVMKFTLHANSYDWEFVPVPGETLTDSGTGTCVGGAIADFTYTEDPLYTVAFTDASVDPNGTVVAWNWDFGDGGTSTLQNPTHTYAAVSAEYEVTLSVTGDDSTTGITTKTVPVGPRPPVVTITEPPEGTTVIEGDLITFTGTAIDAEEGDLTGSLSWSSDLNGVIGSGGSFSTNTLTVGTHTITASATDSGGLQGSATITVTVKMAGLLTVQVRVAASTDDAEEETSGKMDLTSSDLELVNDGGVDQTVGMRFAGVAIPPGAWISDAYVQFQVDETPSLPTFLTIQGEATDNAATFGSADGDISTRPRTGAAVPWDPPPWPTTGVAGMDQRTPQLAAVIQEIVDQGGWASGNALAIIVTGTGQRVAEAFDGVPAAAPLLFVEFHPDPPTPPTTDAGASTVMTSAGNVPPDGTSSATITVTLLDGLNAPVVGHAVSLAQGTGSSTISAPSGASDANGQVTFTVTNTTAEAVTYTATDDTDAVTITQTAQVNFGGRPTDPGTSTVTTSGSNVPADGASSATITVTLLDGANAPVVGHTVSLAPSGGSSTISVPSGPSDANGQVTFTVTNTTAETVTYTATDDTDAVTITQTADVTFDGLPTDAGTSTVTTSASNVPADGTSSATITVTLFDGLGAPVVGQTVSLAQGSGSSTISVPSGPSDASGQVTFTVTNTTAEAVTYTATDDTDGVTIAQTAQVTFDALPSVPGAIDVRVAASSDDAEEFDNGGMYLNSSDLELVFDRGGDQTVGMRFTGVEIPQGTSIADAYVQFQVDAASSEATSLTIEGEATDNAVAFGSATGDISTRPRTSAAVAWAPAPWPTKDVAGPDQRTPTLATVIQEIVNRGGWASGNALVLIITGTGKRVAEAFDGVPDAAPLLHVEFLSGPPSPPTHPGNSSLTTNASNVPADGSSSATITVTLLDGAKAPVVGHSVSLGQTGSSVISGSSGSSDINGQVTFTVTNTTAEAVTYTATDVTDGVTVTQTAQVTFDALPTDPGTSTVTATPGMVPPDGITPATITVTLLNSVNVPVVGHVVSLTQGAGSSTIGAASGPSDANGQVTFTVANTTTETVTYTATDVTDGVTVTQTAQVTFDAAPSVIEVRVAASSDDAEEFAGGEMYLNSSDLELVFDRRGDQTVGMRFNEVAIPQGASISNAYVQFQVDATASGPTSLTIEGEATDHAGTFGMATNNISSRSRTSAAVPWAPVPWATSGEAGPDQRTPDLAAVIQEIVNRGGWASGNSLVIIITGTGERVADSFDGVPAAAPLLHVEYSN